MQAVFYLMHNGEITRSYSGPEQYLEQQLHPGEAWVEGEGTWLTHVVRNGKLMQLSKPRQAPSPYHIWDRDAAKWLDPRDLTQMRADRWEELKQERGGFEEGEFVWRGHTFQMSYGLRAALALYVAVANTNTDFTIELTNTDNVAVLLSAPDIIDLGIQYATWLNGLHARSQALRQKLAAASQQSVNRLTL